MKLPRGTGIDNPYGSPIMPAANEPAVSSNGLPLRLPACCAHLAVEHEGLHGLAVNIVTHLLSSVSPRPVAATFHPQNHIILIVSLVVKLRIPTLRRRFSRNGGWRLEAFLASISSLDIP